MRPRARGRGAVVGCVAAVLLAVVPAPAPAAETPQQALDAILAKLQGASPDFKGVLGQYERIESSSRFDIFGRHLIHAGLLKALRESDSPALGKAAEEYFSASSALPPRILLLKALIGPRFPAPRAKRVEWLLKAARERPQLAVWSAHLLSASRWPEGIEGLIALLAEAESRDPDGLLAGLASAELYRALGPQGLGGSARVAKSWEEMGKKVPGQVDREVPARSGPTSSFFGDRISPRAVFAIDISSSMLQKTHLRMPGKTVVEGKKSAEGDLRPKVEIVKEELKRALAGLLPSSKFSAIGYNARLTPWRGGNPPKLHDATRDSLKNAAEFVEKLRVATGTNIHDVLAAALAIPDVETVYLLTDGVPSVGGGPAEVERRAAAMTYLSGVRIITYGFASPTPGEVDEKFLQRLAESNWGWYRRLN
jgi:hypothetical protein